MAEGTAVPRHVPASASTPRPAREPGDVGRLLGSLVAWWAWTPAIYGLGWCLRFGTPGHRFAQSADQWFYANFLSLGGGLWVWLTIGFIGSVVIVSRTLAPTGPARPL